MAGKYEKKLEMTARRLRTAASGDLKAFLFNDAEWTQIVHDLELSPQQARIVRFIMCGMRDKQVARLMGVSVATVRTHLTRLFSRLTVSDRLELILFVFLIFRATTVTEVVTDIPK